jgi:serine/threonine protein kinase
MAEGSPGSGGPDVKIGDLVGPYRVEEMLGEGGMGIVFRALRQPNGEVVALKVLRTELAKDTTYKRRFIHEARAASAVRHKHIVPVLEAGEVDGRQYLAVAYMPGRTLADRVKQDGALPVADVLRLAGEIASGLDALHEKGIVHRDVKPSNVLLDRGGSAALTDFGLARGRAYTVLTQAGRLVGTVDYMAPELIRGLPAGPHSDIYALGCLVFECVAGSPPFGDKGPFQVGVAHLQEDPPDPCAGRQDAPAELGWAVLQALAKDPGKRPSTATAYASLLRLAAGPR